jgi:hypothetical protein
LADLNVKGVNVGRHRVLQRGSAAVPNAVAAFLLYLRDAKGKVPQRFSEEIIMGGSGTVPFLHMRA